MSIPVIFPDWVPWWAQLACVVVAVLLGLAFLLMPFSVFGVKGRLEAIEARLDEIQGEIRALSLRLPEPARGSGYDEEMILRRAPEVGREMPARPPIPPAAWAPDTGPRQPIGSGVKPGPRGRSEPRLG